MSKNDSEDGKGGKDSKSNSGASQEASKSTSSESNANPSSKSDSPSQGSRGVDSKQSDKQESSHDRDTQENQSQRDKALNAISKGENLGDYGTRETIGMVESAFNARQAEIEADRAWSQGNILEAAKQKLSQLGSEVSHTVQEHYNELTNAPVDYVADAARNPFIASLSMSNPITAGLNLGTRMLDNAMDVYQEEASFKDAGIQALSDLGMVNPTIGFAGEVLQDPSKAMVKAVSNKFGIMAPIVNKFGTELMNADTSAPSKQSNSYSNIQFNQHLGKDGLSQRLLLGQPVDSSLEFATSPIYQAKKAADEASVNKQLADVQKGIQPNLYNPQVFFGVEQKQEPKTQQSLLSFM